MHEFVIEMLKMQIIVIMKWNKYYALCQYYKNLDQLD